jgi:DNA-binding CsgD family transcriptional regulator/pimeloyl-ACP methyl ester carboxylesterase
MAGELTLFDRLADELRLERPAILASGSSVAVAIAIAAMRPNRVSRLGLFGSRVAPVPGEVARLGALDLLLRTRFDLAIDLIAQRVAAGCGDEAIQWFAAAYPQVASPAVLAQWLHEATTRDVRWFLTHVRCPTLLMHRRGDMVVDLRYAVDAAAGMRDAVLLPLDGTESVIWEGDVDALVGPLQRFLAEPLAGDPNGRLTTREREVVLLVAEGLTNEEIGRRLRIGRRTVESRLERARSKLGLQSRAALAAWAARARIS